MRRDPRVAGARNMLSPQLTRFIVAVGISGGVTILLFYAYLLKVRMLPISDARTLAFLFLTLGTILIAFSLKDLRAPLHRIKFWTNRYLLGAFAFAIFGLVLALKIELVRHLLRLSDMAITPHLLPLLIAIIANLFAVEVAKYFLFERRR